MHETYETVSAATISCIAVWRIVQDGSTRCIVFGDNGENTSFETKLVVTESPIESNWQVKLVGTKELTASCPIIYESTGGQLGKEPESSVWVRSKHVTVSTMILDVAASRRTILLPLRSYSRGLETTPFDRH